MDMSQYRALFLSESREYLQEIGRSVVALESAPGDRAEIDSLFRAAHSLKGMAVSMEYSEIVALAHCMEDLMARVRDGALVFEGGVADLLLEGVDRLAGMVTDVEAGRPLRDVGDLPQRLSGYLQKRGADAQAARKPEPPVERLQQTEQELADLPPAGPPAEPVPPGAGRAAVSGPVDEHAPQVHEPLEPATIKVRTEILDHLVSLTGELITNKQRLLNVGREVSSPRLDETIAETTKLLRSLHDQVTQVRLMPFDAIAGRLERSVRDLARRSGKEVHFALGGGEIGLDRGVLEQLGEPLNHLLRNAVDHGLELPEERREAGKPQRGEIGLALARDRDHVVIAVTDDGRGMDPATMVSAALRKGLIGAEEAEKLSPRQALMLCVIPGFSTAEAVTELSGRGVGMDAVNAAVRKLGGTLSIESQPGAGSRFTLRIPLAISIVHALLVRCGKIKSAVPVSAVHRSVELRREQIESKGARPFFYLDGEPVPLLSLHRLLGTPLGRFPGGFVPLFVTEAKGRQVGLIVDELLGQHEVFIKPLRRPLAKLKGVAGGAILGDGEIVSVLDIPNLF